MLNHINTIGLVRLHNEEHFGFHSEFSALVNECSLSETLVSLVSLYNEHYDEYDVAMEIARKSDFSDDILAADSKRNQTFRSFCLAVEGFLHHFDQAKQRAGKRLNIIIRQYGVTPKMARDKKTYALTNLLQDMRAKGAADIQLLGLVTWVSELEANNASYKALKEKRYTERAQLPEQKVRAVRLVVDADYKEITKYLDVMFGISKPVEENLKTLVMELNERIASYNHLIAQRQGISAAQKAAAETSSSFSNSSSLAVA